MRTSRAAWLTIFVAFQLAPIAEAVEPADQFIQGLQERGLNELALDYLEQMKTSQLVDEDFKRKIPYHRGVVLIEQSRTAADPATRARLLDDARRELEGFAQANPDNVRSAEAQLQLASVELAQGQQLVAQASQLPKEAAYDAQRMSLGREARLRFTAARETFARAEAIYSTELGKLPPTQRSETSGSEASQRQEYRARVAQLRFLIAQTQFETAQSYRPSDDEYRQLHDAAAKELASVYDEFARTFIVGLYARLYEGRCYLATGAYPLALGCFEDILGQPNVLPPFRKLIASAVHRKSEALIAQEKYGAAIDNAKACLRDATAAEEKLPEWLAVRFRLAQALQKKGDSLPSDSLDTRRVFAEARDAYRLVSNTPGEFQADARTAAASLGRNNNNAEKKVEPRMFQAAYEAGKDALASYNAAKLAMPAAESNNPDALPELKLQMEQGKENARRFFRAATTLIDDDTDLKLVNEVRYFLCWLYWENEDYYRAAVLGEFLARRYPDHPAAASAAKLSMAAFERLYSQAASAGGTADTEFEARRMAQMAEFIVRRWPDTDDADAAHSVLVSYAIRNNRIDEAEKLLATASADAKPRLELQLGNAMWGRYLELSQKNAKPPTEEAALSQLKQSAQKYLQRGIKVARGEREISESLATAGLYLVQALLAEEKYEDAIQLLENDKTGPLSLLSRKHVSATRPQFAIETYKAALRAYVLVTPPQSDKALDIMKSLDDAAKAGGASEEQLTQIYIGLGVALEKQIDQLRSSARDRDAARVVEAFAQFLDKIAARQAEANWPTRVWIAQTYYKMGAPEGAAATKTTNTVVGQKARGYLSKARDAYRQLIDDAAKNPKFAPNANAVLAAKVQLGECYRALGQYPLALDTFSEVLKEKESSLSVQRAAALAYQERGKTEGVQWLERAIQGGYKLKSTGQHRIWGWLKISQVAARAARADKKYRDTFFEARANVARCRYLAAMKQDGADRQKDLTRAKQGIQSLAQLYPDLGGERWRGEFDMLLKQIQTAAGEKQTGLREFSAGRTPAT